MGADMMTVVPPLHTRCGCLTCSKKRLHIPVTHDESTFWANDDVVLPQHQNLRRSRKICLIDVPTPHSFISKHNHFPRRVHFRGQIAFLGAFGKKAKHSKPGYFSTNRGITKKVPETERKKIRKIAVQVSIVFVSQVHSGQE